MDWKGLLSVLKILLQTPKGIIVNRQEKTSEYTDPKTGEKIHGVFMYTFSIGLKPVVGNWSITAYTGPNTAQGIEVRICFVCRLRKI